MWSSAIILCLLFVRGMKASSGDSMQETLSPEEEETILKEFTDARTLELNPDLAEDLLSNGAREIVASAAAIATTETGAKHSDVTSPSTFKKWKEDVDEEVSKLGEDSDDVPETLWKEMFDEGDSPTDAIERVRRRYGDSDDYGSLS